MFYLSLVGYRVFGSSDSGVVLTLAWRHVWLDVRVREGSAGYVTEQRNHGGGELVVMAKKRTHERRRRRA